ncbi:DUF2878 family protein, partial [Mycobacterium tuberculosis]|nr:DUF2878 family protein [Mycobacterium tuberculosis]
AGLIDFRGDSLLPLWMVALWLMFAVVWTRLTRTATLPGWVLATGRFLLCAPFDVWLRGLSGPDTAPAAGPELVTARSAVGVQ